MLPVKKRKLQRQPSSFPLFIPADMCADTSALNLTVYSHIRRHFGRTAKAAAKQKAEAQRPHGRKTIMPHGFSAPELRESFTTAPGHFENSAYAYCVTAQGDTKLKAAKLNAQPMI